MLKVRKYVLGCDGALFLLSHLRNQADSFGLSYFEVGRRWPDWRNSLAILGGWLSYWELNETIDTTLTPGNGRLQPAVANLA